MTPILTSEQMRAADRAAIEEHGIPGLVLMENASRGACDVLASLLEGLDGRELLVLCGRGNNGGDGLALARHAAIAGAAVQCVLLADPEELSGDAAAQLRMLDGFEEVQVSRWAGAPGGAPAYDAVVDAVLGTGARGELTGAYAEAIAWGNTLGGLKYALDVPTGVDADTGHAGSVAFEADATATMAALKPGLLLDAGAQASGDLYVVSIGSPPALYRGSGLELLDEAGSSLRQRLASVDPGRNKYDRGKALVIAGSRGMTGAGAMAAEAALHAGAGLTVLALPEGVAAAMPHALAHEIMTLALPATEAGSFASHAFDDIDLHAYTALAIGPGLSRSEETAAAVRRLLGGAPLPVVLDADGINAFAGRAEELHERTCPLVITPHHGEMARLLGVARTEVSGAPLAVARDAASRFNCIVVLKGAPTVIAVPDGRAWINGAGNPGMATGGTGDVLTGVIAALLAGFPDWLAATLAAVYLHSRAADIASDRTTVHALTASDIIRHLHDAYRAILSRNG
ncbi:MAG TPA: NAD(P)H-hydrate dehydratase [Candidatus Kapabacteria bacterium]|nr:NAD(P)H-hydrate dehydratase [Candidatus Kapabacteria bacterium]